MKFSSTWASGRFGALQQAGLLRPRQVEPLSLVEMATYAITKALQQLVMHLGEPNRIGTLRFVMSSPTPPDLPAETRAAPARLDQASCMDSQRDRPAAGLLDANGWFPCRPRRKERRFGLPVRSRQENAHDD